MPVTALSEGGAIIAANPGASSISVAVTTAIPAGTVVIAAGELSTGQSPKSQSITDSQNNLWVPSVNILTDPIGLVAASKLTTALTTSDTITYALSPPQQDYAWISYLAFSGLKGTTAYATASVREAANDDSSSISVTTSAAVAAGDLVVAYFNGYQGPTVGPSAPWTKSTSTSSGVAMYWRIAPGTGTVTASATQSGLNQFSAIIAAYSAGGNVGSSMMF